MLGAIIGDVVGSIYEFNNYRKKDFNMFSNNCFFTDDSIMTLAVMEIMQNKYYYDKNKIINTLKKWGRAYPDRGYGGMFYHWLFSNNRNSYNSFGNGAAMRISPVGYYAKSEEEVKDISRRITEVTHSHPEGIKGAEVTAMCIYYAKIGKSKAFIKEYASKYYNLDFEYEELKRNYSFKETCQETVPQAIYCFLISNDFEDCIRTSISIGGDSDTLAAIACAIAEAYYKHIERRIIMKLRAFIPEDNNECYPSKIINKYINNRIYHLCSSEKINSNTKILSIAHKADLKNIVLEFNYSKDIKILLECAYEKITELFPDVNIIKDLYHKNLESVDSVISANVFLNHIRDSYELECSLIIHDSPIDALKLLEDEELSDGMYDEIFNKEYNFYVDIKRL